MARRSRARATRIEVDLMMECVDDELSPWQLEANKRAEAEYKDALNRIQAAKARALAMASTVPVENSMPVTVTNVNRPSPADSPDVIIVDETPAPRTATRKKVPTPIPASNKGSTASKSPGSKPHVQPVMFTPGVGPNGQPILLPNQSFSQYQIIQTVGGQAQIITRPVTVQPGGQMVTNLIRAPTGIPIQRVPAQPRKQPVNVRNAQSLELTPVAGTHGLGVKRSTPACGAAEPPKKRQAGRQSTEKDEAGNWVPLDEYYYGKKEGDPAYREEKAEFRFKCWYCHKMLYNNLRIMMHMQGHIDSEKQQNLDLSDLTQCKHCYKQFDTPFEMQCHIEKVHQNQSNVLVCRICEKDHDSQTGLRTHMRAYHNACEMPYICQLCNFRSSIFSDVVDHFKKRHDSSQYMMCLYCLRVFKINFSKSSGWGLTQNYYQHLQKHQLKNSCRKCPCCKLTFVNKADAKLHRSKDHLPNYKGILGAGAGTMTTTTADQEQVMIKVPEKKSNQLKSLNAPASSKVRALGGVQFRNQLRDLHCYECGNAMGTQDHYKKYVECSMCRFATTCNYSYMNHMTGFHAGNQAARMASVPRERPMKQVMYCLCGYSSKYGNVIANHLVSCSKRTTYTNKREMRWFEYDDEQEEFNPFEPYIEEPDTPDTESPKKDKEITLFDALGLVKRAPKPGQQKQGAQQKDQDPLQVIDVPQPAGDEIPAELTGGQKWSTVKFPETEAPSKNSIFLGANDEKTEENKVTTDDASKDTSTADDQVANFISSHDSHTISSNKKVVTDNAQDNTHADSKESNDNEQSEETKPTDQQEILDVSGVGSAKKMSTTPEIKTVKSKCDLVGTEAVQDCAEDQPSKHIDDANCDNVESSSDLNSTQIQAESNSAIREQESMDVEGCEKEVHKTEEADNADIPTQSGNSKMVEIEEESSVKNLTEKSSVEEMSKSKEHHVSLEIGDSIEEDGQYDLKTRETHTSNMWAEPDVQEVQQITTDKQNAAVKINVDTEVENKTVVSHEEEKSEDDKHVTKSENEESLKESEEHVMESVEDKHGNVSEDDKKVTKSKDDKHVTKSEDDKHMTESKDDKHVTKSEDDKHVTESKDDKHVTKSEDEKHVTESEDDQTVTKKKKVPTATLR